MERCLGELQISYSHHTPVNFNWNPLMVLPCNSWCLLNGNYFPYSFYSYYLEFFCKKVILSPHLFIQSFMSDSWIFKKIVTFK